MSKTISLELAKKLKKVADENGYELPESEKKWYWQDFPIMKNNKKGEIICESIKELHYIKGNRGFIYNAYTTDELLEDIWKGTCHITTIYPNAGKWHIGCEILDVDFREEEFIEALGKLYEYLIANKLIK